MTKAEFKTTEALKKIGLGTLRTSARGVPHLLFDGAACTMSVSYFLSTHKYKVFWPWPDFSGDQKKKHFDTAEEVKAFLLKESFPNEIDIGEVVKRPLSASIDKIQMINGVSYYWKLDGKTPVPATIREMGEQYEKPDSRRIGSGDVNGYSISTVFLAMNHRFGGEGPPILFETMIFPKTKGRPLEDYQVRYETYDEALAGHLKAVLLASKPDWLVRIMLKLQDWGWL